MIITIGTPDDFPWNENSPGHYGYLGQETHGENWWILYTDTLFELEMIPRIYQMHDGWGSDMVVRG